MFSNLKKILSRLSGRESEDRTSSLRLSLKAQPALPTVKTPMLPAPAPSLVMPQADSMALPLASIIRCLPENLRPKGKHLPGATVLVAIHQISEQLHRGAVKISFKELKQAAPPGIFRDNPSEDPILVELPIQEIIPRLNPASLKRRPDQRRVAVAPNVPPVFGPNGETVSLVSTCNSENRLTVAIPLPPPSPASPAIPAPVLATEPEASRLNVLSLPPNHLATPADQKSTPSFGGHETDQAVLPGQKGTGEGWVIPVSLQKLAAKWPVPIRQEITQGNLFSAIIELPSAEIEPGLTSGKLVFSWKRIRSWIKKLPVGSSPHDEVQLELPLPFIVPLFLAHNKGAKARKTVRMTENVPDIFTSAASAAALSTPAAASVSLPLHVVPPLSTDSGDPPAEHSNEAPADFGRIFGQPEKRNWTPVEIVQKTSTLPGVVGAVLALQDGLLVAGELPPGYSAETFAAFLPQMFEKMNQYAQAMKLGSPEQLSLLVENVCLQIFKTSRVYFAVISHPQRPLPMAKLAAITSELERYSK